MKPQMDTPEFFAKVAWTPGDIMTLAPQMSEAEAMGWLLNNERYIQNRLVEVGRETIRSLLEYDGIATKDPG